jgi:group I intron endonuclease
MVLQVIYKILNVINNKIYIGSTVNYNTRKYDHIWSLNNGKHRNKILQRAWNKYGKDNFIFEIVETIDNLDDLLIREQHYINLFKSYKRENGYNINPIAGSNLGFKMPDEAKEKLRIINTGKKHSDETRKKISEVQKGKKRKFISKLITSQKCRGENNPSSKLNWQAVLEIRDKKNKNVSAKELSKEYNVCLRTIYNIVSGNFWKEGEYCVDQEIEHSKN